MFAASAPQSPCARPSAKLGFNRTLFVLLISVIILVAVIATALFLGPALSVTRKNFTPYSTPVSQDGNNPSSLNVTDTNGGITVAPWSQAYLMVNGTVSARGIGANPDAITFDESNSSGKILFEAVFPPGTFFFSSAYTVDINVYVPASAYFYSIQSTTVNGDVQISNINASGISVTDTNGKINVSGIRTASLTLTDTNGSIGFTCFCADATATTKNGAITANLPWLPTSGTFTLTSTDGNIDLKLPASGQFAITANTVNGIVSSSGLSAPVTNHVTSRFGLGLVGVTATTTNGSVTITGV